VHFSVNAENILHINVTPAVTLKAVNGAVFHTAALLPPLIMWFLVLSVCLEI